MSAEFTVGPWTAEQVEPDFWQVRSGHNTVVVRLDRRRDGFSPYRERCEADARLIAAAPALRAALKDAIDSFEATGTLSDAVVANACELLARVDGESTGLE